MSKNNPRRPLPGTRVTTKGDPRSPAMIVNRHGNYGDEVECVWWAYDDVGRPVLGRVWLASAVLEECPHAS